MHLLVTNEQFAKAGEPRVGHFDHPAPRSLTLGPLRALLAARAHVGGVVTVAHILRGGSADEAGIRAQMLSSAWRHATAGRGATMASRVAANWVTSLRLAAVTMIDSGTPRASTSNIRLLPFFSPVGGVGPHRLLRQWCLQ